MTPASNAPGMLGRLAHRFEALSAPWKTAVVATLGFLLSQFVDWRTHDWLTRELWEPIGTFLRWLAARPIGAIGIVIAAALVVLALSTSVRATSVGGALATRIKGPRQAELDKRQRLLDEAGTEIRKLGWWINWGVARPSVAYLAPDELDKARTEVARFEMVLGLLASAVKQISDELVLSLQSDLGQLARQSFYDHEIAPMKRVLALARQPGDEDPRAAFNAFYARYIDFRRWVQQVAAAEKRVLVAFPGYPKWREADTAFLRKLSEMANIPAIADVWAVVHRDVGIPNDLQPPADSTDGSGLTVTLHGVEPDGTPPTAGSK